MILQDNITESCCGIIFRDYITELYYRITLQDHIRELYYGVILLNYITGLYYGTLMDDQNSHSLTNIQRQKLSITVFEPACWDPSPEGLDGTVLSIKGRPLSERKNLVSVLYILDVVLIHILNGILMHI